jgi:beta-lactamase superfamily II metal-dependent hydrolase
MTKAPLTVSIRMYNVGFGDAFTVTVRSGRRQWRMLIDCGVHSHGRARPISEIVDAIIRDLTPPDKPPSVDVIVATHQHADHISGFELDQWSTVHVGEVWVPYVEDEADPDSKVLRKKIVKASVSLSALLKLRLNEAEPDGWLPQLAMAQFFADNSRGNDKARQRLLGLVPEAFATKPTIRYLPSSGSEIETIESPIPRVVAHVLGPSRLPKYIKKMDPPKAVGWMAFDRMGEIAKPNQPQLFSDRFVLSRSPDMADLSHGDFTAFGHLTTGHQALRRLDELNDTALLAAASVLERSVNNTSLFFVLDVGGTRLLFPGDAQQGAWDHITDNPDARQLIADVDFYKMSHHGSHNGTPKPWVEQVLTHHGVQAMLPFGLVKRWKDTIPEPKLLESWASHGHTVVRADAPTVTSPQVTVQGDLWTEITFKI